MSQHPDHALYYAKWRKYFSTVSKDDKEAILKHQNQFKINPKIAVIIDSYGHPSLPSAASINSITGQLYERWQLYIISGSKIENPDPRIKYLGDRELLRQILNAEEIDYIIFLSPGDFLAEHALYLMVYAINMLPEAKIIYSDQDFANESGAHTNPLFYGELARQFLYSSDSFSGGILYKFSEIKDFFNKFYHLGASEAYRIALQASLKFDYRDIVHIPHIIYHKTKKIPSGDLAKVRADFFRQEYPKVNIDYENKNLPYIIWPLPKIQPSVTIIIPTKDNYALLKNCMESIFEKTNYENFSVLIISNQSSDNKTLKYFESIKKQEKVNIISYDHPFNFSAICNFGAAHAGSENIVFLNDDTEIINSEWLAEMAGYAIKNDVGAIGAKLLFPDGRLQHAGVIVGASLIASHYFYAKPDADDSYMNRADIAAEVSAVSGACMMIRKKLFEELGGFDENNLAIAFNDVDLCLKLKAKGYRTIYTPFARLIHHESASRGYDNKDNEKLARLSKEAEYMNKKWAIFLNNDPHYNANLDKEIGDFSLGFPPRSAKPWLSFKKPEMPVIITRIPPIITLGMHRSGTSLIAEILERMGVFMGSNKDSNNEDLFFLNLNESMFKDNNAYWDAPENLKTALAKKSENYCRLLYKIFESRKISEYLGPLYKKYFTPSRIKQAWGWKDPRSSFTLPVWKELFPEAKIIHVYRHGVDVAESLKKRNESGTLKRNERCGTLIGGFSLWQEYMEEINRHMKAWPDDILQVKYEDLLENPSLIINKIGKFCGLTVSGQILEECAHLCRKDEAYKFRNNIELMEFANTHSEELALWDY